MKLLLLPPLDLSRLHNYERKMITIFLQQLFNGIIVGGVYALIAVGLTTIFGLMHVVNFAHGEFYMLGGMMAFLFMQSLQINYFLALVASIAAVMVIGFLVEKILLKRLRITKIDILVTGALVTIGVSIFFQNTGLLIFGSLPKLIPSPFSTEPLRIGPFLFGRMYVFAAIVTIVIILSIHFIIKKTKMGMAMRATFQDKDVAAMAGVNIDRVFSFTFMVGAGLAATAGALLGPIYIIYPNVGESVVLKAFVIVIMGGMGNFIGAILAALILGVVEGLGAAYISTEYKDLIGFVIVLVILAFRPSGLFGKMRKL
jgi:branched-chain amino acid transport system permease protein